MIVPVIIDPFHSDEDYLYHWVYLKNLQNCHRQNVPIIAMERFAEYQFTNPGHSSMSPVYRSIFDFELLSQKEAEQVDRYFIPESLFQNLIREKGSKLAAVCHLLNERYEPLEELLVGFLHEIIEVKGLPVQALTNWVVHFRSVKAVAEKYNLKCIAMEQGPIRPFEYLRTAFFCFEDIHSSGEGEWRYERFQKEVETSPVPVFSQKELLAIMLQRNHLDKLNLMDLKPKYEAGLAGGLPVDAPLFAHSAYTDIEVIQDLLRLYEKDDIIFRMHPGEAYNATYDKYELRQDRSESVIQFLLSCQRVVSLGANIPLETMLWGRTPHTPRALSPFSVRCVCDITNKNLRELDVLFLNFAVFALLVPFTLMWSPEYISWRLTNPPETEIYRWHLSWYLHAKGINEVLIREPEGRLERLLSAQGYNPGRLQGGQVSETLPFSKLLYETSAGWSGFNRIYGVNRIDGDRLITQFQFHDGIDRKDIRSMIFVPVNDAPAAVEIISVRSEAAVSLVPRSRHSAQQGVYYFSAGPAFTVQYDSKRIRNLNSIEIAWRCEPGKSPPRPSAKPKPNQKPASRKQKKKGLLAVLRRSSRLLRGKP